MAIQIQLLIVVLITVSLLNGCFLVAADRGDRGEDRDGRSDWSDRWDDREDDWRGHRDVVRLYQSDFDQGTYRITESGEYQIMEHISFSPRPDNDFWNDPRDPKYPIAEYYLGFFAAITVEADDVTIDLNGHTIEMGKEFYLLQRFFNVIELNNIVFTENEGVEPLSFQAGDKVEYPGVQHTFGGLTTVKNVKIKNGVVGRSSHAGVHGNGAEDIVLEDLQIKDFEVAGFQCNGCKDVVVDRCTVGPAATAVPTLATFSSARFIDRFVNDMIPQGFAREGRFASDLQALLQETIKYADRDEEVVIQAVFDRLKRAIVLYTDLYMNRLSSDLSQEDQELLEEAKRVFNNPSGLTDGGVLYGILFANFGIPHGDENFYGPGTETRDITIRRTEITGLYARPIEVPAIQTFAGDVLQGPARDLIRFSEISESYRSLSEATYKGNFLSDVYFAFWQVSNKFYQIRIYDSPCGNFGTNASNPYPLAGQAICLDGQFQDPENVDGRGATLYNKRYFGGLVMSQEFFNWGTTEGATIDQVLSSHPVPSINKVTKHNIVCGGDTMFHPIQGVLGLKFIEAKNVNLDRVTVNDLYNYADADQWICNQKWKIYSSSEDISPLQRMPRPQMAADVIGIQVVLSDDIDFSRVHVRTLRSDEGSVYGLKIEGDTNDRTDYRYERGITFDRSSITDLISGQHTYTMLTTGTEIPRNGISLGEPAEIEYPLHEPKTLITYGYKNVYTPNTPSGPWPPAFDDTWAMALSDTPRNTEEKLKKFKIRCFRFIEEHYGLVFSEDVANLPLREFPTLLNPDGTPNDAIVAIGAINSPYRPTSFCAHGECYEVDDSSYILDTFFTVYAVSGFMSYGVFGGDNGKFVSPGDIVFAGYYSIQGLHVPGVSGDIVVDYFGTCPVAYSFGGRPDFVRSSMTISCALESDTFGKGTGVGSVDFVFVPATETEPDHWIVDGYNVMAFDDDVDHPVSTEVFGTHGTTFENPPRRMIVSIIADGSVPNWNTLLNPLGANYHWYGDAGVKYLKQFTAINTDEKIAALRKQFLTRLRDMFGISVNPDAFDNVPLTGIVDLGGGNQVVAYVVNEIVNFRSLTRQDYNNKAQIFPPGSRIHEGGFLLRAGRAGRATNYGQIPRGSLLKEGVLVFENLGEERRGRQTQEEATFYTRYAIIPNNYGTSSINYAVSSPTYGEGSLILGVGGPMHDSLETQANVRGSLFFD